eukprot:CAMPEP_0174726216 /NCGR_PEP_ID=MMETSP1094-20130205/47252_1 /TAXON_ID=156173 /ORGANISM="Chrysochromulina brevifilum, Strain UTEX LB 985" /LENGTH=109 /DNA_ID=CAMNT_0015927741 /DNA_START=152 /DNA_END=481 /DNA_ORIENTATION=-
MKQRRWQASTPLAARFDHSFEHRLLLIAQPFGIPRPLAQEHRQQKAKRDRRQPLGSEQPPPAANSTHAIEQAHRQPRASAGNDSADRRGRREVCECAALVGNREPSGEE